MIILKEYAPVLIMDMSGEKITSARIAKQLNSYNKKMTKLGCFDNIVCAGKKMTAKTVDELISENIIVVDGNAVAVLLHRY